MYNPVLTHRSSDEGYRCTTGLLDGVIRGIVAGKILKWCASVRNNRLGIPSTALCYLFHPALLWCRGKSDYNTTARCWAPHGDVCISIHLLQMLNVLMAMHKCAHCNPNPHPIYYTNPRLEMLATYQ
jgi:hypothetical protein